MQALKGGTVVIDDLWLIADMIHANEAALFGLVNRHEAKALAQSKIGFPALTGRIVTEKTFFPKAHGRDSGRGGAEADEVRLDFREPAISDDETIG